GPRRVPQRHRGRAQPVPRAGRGRRVGRAMSGARCSACVVFDPTLTAYDFGPAHPMSPTRVDLTVRLAQELGVVGGDGLATGGAPPGGAAPLPAAPAPAH